MSGFLDYYPKNWPNLNPTFNSADFAENYDTVTQGELNNYGNLYANNTWTGTNFFDSILVSSINSVSSNVLTFLENITGDVQLAINNLNSEVGTLQTITTNMAYNSTSNTTTINDNLIVTSINGVSSTVLSYLVGISGNVQNAINNLNTKTTNITYNPVGNITTINDNFLANYINGVALATFVYLADITEDVQSAINNLKTITTNMAYDSTNNITSITDYFYVTYLATNNNVALANDLSVSNELNVPIINNLTLLTNSITTNSIKTNSIVCNGPFSSTSDIGAFFYTLVVVPSYGQSYTTTYLTIPIMKSGLVSNFMSTPTTPFFCMITLKPNYSIGILNSSGTFLAYLSNTTNNFIYNQEYTLNYVPYRINLYLNNILLE